MSELKVFEKSDLEIIQSIVGLKLNNIFKQLDMFVISFGDEIEYALHICCCFRIRKEKQIIMTAADEYYYANHERMIKKDYKKDEMHEKSLLKYSIQNTKELLKDSVIKEVKISDTADIVITFGNGIVIESFVDFLCQDYELFRFFKHKELEEPHYVVKYSDEKIVIEKVVSNGNAYKIPDSKKLLKLKAKLKKKK
jgi:hypothetical protein